MEQSSRPRIDVYSHYFKITNYSVLHEKVIQRFADNRFTEKERIKLPFGQGWQENIISVYYVKPKFRNEYRFHINILKEFLMELSDAGVTEPFLEIVYNPTPVPVKANFNLTDERIPREDQKEIIDYILSPGKFKMIRSQTGFGKTFCNNQAISTLGNRVCLIVKPMYIQRWIDDLKISFGDAIRIRTVSGSLQLMGLMNEASAGMLYDDIIIISNATYRNYIMEYIEKPENLFSYSVTPDNFFTVIGAGLRTIDEVHMDFNFNFKCDLFTNIEKVLSLSATLVSRNKFLVNMYRIAYPEWERSPEMEHNKYIQADALFYHLARPQMVKYKQKGRRSYSHSVFEASILKDKRILSNYINMFVDVTKRYFIKVRKEKEENKPNMKILLFFNRTEMCTEVTKVFKQVFSNLRVERLIAGDPKSVLKDADIVISTLKSCGTAVDIKGLIRVVMSDAVDSIQSNEQALGRLRNIEELWPDVVPIFAYMVCSDIATHHRYHRNKIYSLRGKVLNMRSIQTHYLV